MLSRAKQTIREIDRKKVFAVIILALVCLLVAVSCSEKAYQFTDSAGDPMPREPATPNRDGGAFNYSYAYDSSDFSGSSKIYSSVEDSEMSTDNAASGEKIIYTSRFTVHTEEFDTATAALDALLEKYGAYYESAECRGTAESADRYGYYTVRVPAENYKAFRRETGSIGVVVYSSEDNKNITEQYFDTEAHLASAKIREERLLDILRTADTLDNVLLLEAELADVRYEIESLSGTLRKYDSLVSYSTVTVELHEVVTPTVITGVPRTFGERISMAAANGFRDFSNALQDIAVFFSYNLPGILLFVVVILIMIVSVRIAIKRSRKKHALPTASDKSPSPTEK